MKDVAKCSITHNVEAVGDVPLQRTNFLHALSCGILPTACYRIVLFFVRWAFHKSLKMGYIKHHTIVVTGWQDEKIKEAHLKAKEVFEKNFESDPYEKPFASRLVSEIIQGLTNGQSSFFIAPDGSKEGWETSDNGDNARKEFLDWLLKVDNYCDYVEVIFGGDDGEDSLVSRLKSDLDALS